MNPTITLKQTAMECFQVQFQNGAILGEFYREVDGFYYFEPWWKEGSGCIASHILRALADKLDELNKDWSEFIEKNLNPPKPGQIDSRWPKVVSPSTTAIEPQDPECNTS